MADFFMPDEGANLLIASGIPAAGSGCKFDLSTKSVGATNPFVVADNYASRSAETGTGYQQQSKTRNTPASRSATMDTAVQFATGVNTGWSATERSIVLSNGSVFICAWNLQAGGTARDMSQANTTETVTVTFGPVANP